MVLGIILYFSLTTSLLALLLLDPARQWASRSIRHLIANFRLTGGDMAEVGRARLARAGRAAHAVGSRAIDWSRRHLVHALLTAAVLAGAPLVALGLLRWQSVDGFDHMTSHRVNEQVAALLNGEQLVPPVALPPEVFAAREVQAVRPFLGQASREWGLFDDEFRQRLLIVFKIMREQHGYDMVLLEGYRGPERQAQLASAGPHLTMAGAFHSFHQFGLAADCAFMDHGRIVISETNPWALRGYELYGEVARSVGLEWGGGWARLKDLGHVELQRPGILGRGGRSPPPLVGIF